MRYRAKLLANTPLLAAGRSDTGAPTQHVRCLRLQVEGTWPSFHAGQYLGLLAPDGTPVFFSIASLPAELPHIELHYAATPGSPDVARMDAILAAPTIEFSAPEGTTGLFAVPHAKSVMMAAAATGIAQALAIARSWAMQQKESQQTDGGATQPTRPGTITLYWGVRTVDQLYCADLLDELARVHAGFSWHPVVSDQPSWTGRKGLLVDAMREDAERADEAWGSADVVIISGSPAMVQATANGLREAGVTPDRMRSDLL